MSLCFGWMLQAGSVLAQHRLAVGRVAGGLIAHDHPAVLSDIEFIPNRGQLADQFGKPMSEVLYTLDGHGVKFYFTKNSMHYVFSKLAEPPAFSKSTGTSAFSRRGQGVVDPGRDTLSLYRVDAHFLGANPNVTITAEDSASNYTNYYLPQCPNGITRVPAFHKIVYHDLYPHIDMVVYAGEGRAQHVPKDPNTINLGSDYDFIVRPGGDPKQIQVRYDGQDSLVLNGNLRVVSPFGEVTELAPASFQGERRVASGYLLQSNILSYKIGAYNHARDLTIDPPRLWGTYFGGAGGDYVSGIGVDRHNNVDVVGYTSSTRGIATTGAYQTTLTPSATNGFIASFDPSGNIRWATYYGGNVDDYFWNCACDTSCGIVATGSTESTTGIATLGAYQTTYGGNLDAFVVSFDSNGVRLWGTYFGGTGTDFGHDVAVDSADNVLVIGTTSSTAGIATPGAYQVTHDSSYIAKFTADGSILWATYYGCMATLYGYGEAISCDGSNHIYVSGTPSASGLATPGAYQTTLGLILLAKFLPNGQRDWATYYFTPGSVSTFACHIAASRTGNLYVCGGTDEDDHATPNAFQTHLGGGFGPTPNDDGFLIRFDSSGRLAWATYYGGSGVDEFFGIGVDTAENVVAGGATYSTTRIASPGEYQTTLIGSSYSPFLVKFDSSGNRLWGTYYGEDGSITGVSIDRLGHPAAGGYTNTTTNMFASPGAYQTTNGGGEDGWIAMFCDVSPVHISGPVESSVCPGTNVTLSATSGLARYQWLRNGVQISGETNETYSLYAPATPGVYAYTVSAFSASGCDAIVDTFYLTVHAPPTIPKLARIVQVCAGSAVQIGDKASGVGPPFLYRWLPAAGLTQPDDARPAANPLATTKYYVTVTDSTGCQSRDSVEVVVNPVPTVDAGPDTGVCPGGSVMIGGMAQSGVPPYTFDWAPGAGLSNIHVAQPIATPKTSMTYTEWVTDSNGCSSSSKVIVSIYPLPHANLNGPNSVCPNATSSYTVSDTTPDQFIWSLAGGGTINSGQGTNKVDVHWTSKGTWPLAVKVITPLGCERDIILTVSVNDSLHPMVTPDGPLKLCEGDTAVLHAPSGYKTYTWSTGTTTDSLPVANTGSYSVSVTDDQGCSGSSQPVTITAAAEPKPVPLIVLRSDTLCSGDSTLLITSEPFASYLWSTGETSPSIVVLAAGSFSVMVTDTFGCSGVSDPVEISVASRPRVVLDAQGPTTLCDGDSVTLAATPGYHYIWWNGGTKLPDTTQSIIVKASGSYAVTATSNAGCDSTTAPVVVTVNPSPNPSITGPASACPNSTTTYSVANVSSDSYAWSLTPSGAGTTASPSSASTSIQWGTVGTVTLSLTETAPDGCSTTVDMPISITSNLTPIVSGPSAVCPGDSITLDAGNGYTSYQWSRDGTLVAGATNETLLVDLAGTYTVFVTSAGGCSGTSAPATITIYPLPAKPIITRNGAALRSTPSAHYQWSFAGSLLTDSVNQTIVPNTAGLYTVTITDTNGCSNTSDPYVYSKGDTVAYASVSVPHGMLAAPGVTVSIPLTLDSSNGLAARGAANYVATIGLDSSMLTPISPAGVLIGNRWMVSLAGLTPATPGILQTITALAADSGFCSGLTIDTFYFTGASIPVTERNGLVCLTAPCTPILHSSDTAFTIKRIFPNPTEASFTIAYHIAAEGPLSMELDDYLGRNVQTLKDEWSKNGDKEETYSVQAIPSGIYRLVLRSVSAQSGTRALSKMLVVTK